MKIVEIKDESEYKRLYHTSFNNIKLSYDIGMDKKMNKRV